MTAGDILKEHTIVDIDDYVHVWDNRCVCYEPGTIDFEDAEQLQLLFEGLPDLEEWLDFPFKRDWEKRGIRMVINGKKQERTKWVHGGYLDNLSPEILQKVKEAIQKYEEERSNHTVLVKGWLGSGCDS